MADDSIAGLLVLHEPSERSSGLNRAIETIQNNEMDAGNMNMGIWCKILCKN